MRRVARDLIANDESEINEVVRRRLFEDIGSTRMRQRVSKAYADWCFERSARLPSEWTAVDTATSSAKARDFLRDRFESCYPFHPATLSVFQRKWRALSQFQQTRGALAMLAQWISWASREQFKKARNEPLITLGSAPLDVPEFRAVVLGQIGEQRLDAAIDADLAGDTAHAKALDVDAKGSLRDIHRRVGTAILFESSGGQVDKVAHLPELRFALGEPEVETNTIDNAATALEKSGFFMRRVGADGYRIHHQATLRKVVSDRRASLDEETEIKPAIRKVVQDEFARGAPVPVVYFPENGDAVQDSPRLTLIILDPAEEWRGNGQLVERICRWTRERGKSPRLYPAALVWCTRKPGRELRESVELWLAWRRVAQEVSQGVLGTEFDRADRADVQARVRDAEQAAKDDVWAGYRFVALGDAQSADGLKVIDLGAGHSSSSESLCGRVLAALKSGALLNESVGAGYIDRHWPPAFKDAGAWPLTSLRQSFLSGALTRLMDPDAVLRRRVVDFVASGDFGLASGDGGNGEYERVWYREPVGAEEVAFESGVLLLTKVKAERFKMPVDDMKSSQLGDQPSSVATDESTAAAVSDETQVELPIETGRIATLRLKGTVPPEVWNRLGTRILPKLRSGDDLSVGVEFSVSVDAGLAQGFQLELQQSLDDLGLAEQVRVDTS